MPVKKSVGRKAATTNNTAEAPKMAPKPKKVCVFCENGTVPTYTDSAALRRFVSDRSKIVTRARTGTCSKHQRMLSREIKHARHLALLPFMTRI